MKKSIRLFAAAIVAIGLFPSVSQGHHRSGHNGGPPHSNSASDNTSTLTTDSGSLLTSRQRTLIENILGDDDDQLIDVATRREIRSQLDSLPPGIQRRLARGRELPPGIAKKVYLSTQLNESIDLNDDVRIVVVGRDAVVVDPVTELIVDILRGVLL